MVILTGMSGEDFKDRAAKLGVEALLHKPCAHDDFVRACDRAIQKKT